MNKPLEGKVAVVTGGGKGVGRGIVLALAAAGAKVCGTYNTSSALAEKTMAEIKASGGDAFLMKCNVNSREEIRAMLSETVRRYGHIDILVNNAAMQLQFLLDGYEADAFRTMWDTNIGGYMRMAQEAFPYLKESKAGRIINVGSIHGKRPTGFDPIYAMTKGAIKMFTREAAIEFGAYGITVNTVELGGVEIEGKTGDPEWRVIGRKSGRGYPRSANGHRGKPADVGNLCVFICSDGSEYMTGSGVRMDAGMMLL